ncbi:MAG: tetratricopeptide repeat protein [Betaproteobacteria bacterium]|nr:tetratricopeptide repeat protein [Betaproteobacteria bacterium]
MATLARVRALHESGRYSEALPLAQEAVAAATALGDRAVQFRALTAMGHVLRASGDFEGALNLHGAALKLAESYWHHDDMALGWNNIGVIFQVGSAWELAIECFARVTDQAPLNSTPAAYLARVNMALCYMHLGDEAAGLPEAETALGLEESPTCPKTIYTSLLLRHAYVQMALKSERLTPETIRTHAAAAAALGNPDGDPRCAILQALISGSLTVAYGDREAGITTLEGARAIAQQVPDMVADTLACLIDAEKLAGRPGRAQQYLAEWLKHVYHDANWQALQKLNLRSLSAVGETLEILWYELTLNNQPPPYPYSGTERPTLLPAGLIKTYLKLIDKL